jgi:hypothetical protein
MHSDLIDSGILKGKTRREVVELLGDDGCNQPELLGYGMASPGIDPFGCSDWGENLFIAFDKQTGCVSRIWIED